MFYEFMSSINLLHTIHSLIKVISAQELCLIVIDCLTSRKCIGIGYSLVSYIFKNQIYFKSISKSSNIINNNKNREKAGSQNQFFILKVMNNMLRLHFHFLTLVNIIFFSSYTLVLFSKFSWLLVNSV